MKRAGIKLARYVECMKCLYFTSGKCYYYSSSGFSWSVLSKTFGVRIDKPCIFFVNSDVFHRLLAVALATSRDAKTYNDKTLAETAIIQLRAFKRMLYKADEKAVDNEIQTLKTVFDLDMSNTIEWDKIYQSVTAETVRWPSFQVSFAPTSNTASI